jgi:hypothetical protein
MVKLANLLASGRELPADPERARALFEQAIAVGGPVVASAADGLGDLYRADTPIRDPAKAAEAYQRAVAAGNEGSVLKLALTLMAGDDATAGFEAAVRVLEGAIASGFVEEPALMLGDMYLALESEASRQTALDYYERAAAAGNPRAHLTMAQLLAADDEYEGNIEQIAAHLTAASRLVGTAEVAAGMLRFRPHALVGMLQYLLTKAGYPVLVDGITGGYTRVAVRRFCRAHLVANCTESLMSTSLLAALLDVQQDAQGVDEQQ